MCKVATAQQGDHNAKRLLHWASSDAHRLSKTVRSQGQTADSRQSGYTDFLLVGIQDHHIRVIVGTGTSSGLARIQVACGDKNPLVPSILQPGISCHANYS